MASRERRSSTRDALPSRRRPSEGDVTVVDVNDPEFLRRFVTEQGKILPQRHSGLTAKQQRQLKRGVRRARTIGLMM